MNSRTKPDASSANPRVGLGDRALAELRVAMAQRRVKDGEKIIARQRALLERIKTIGGSTFGAESLLFTMVSTQVQMRKQLELLTRDAENTRRRLRY